ASAARRSSGAPSSARGAAAPSGARHERGGMSEGRPDYCPRCGVAYEPLQEYCLECGARLPTNRGVVGVLAASWQRRFAWYPGDWVWPTLLFLGLTILATAAAVVARAERSGGNRTLVATSPAVTVGLGAGLGRVAAGNVTSTLPGAPAPTITTGPLPSAPGSARGAAPTTPAPA